MKKLNILKGFWSSQLLFEKMGKYFEENNLMVWELKKKKNFLKKVIFSQIKHKKKYFDWFFVLWILNVLDLKFICGKNNQNLRQDKK